MNEWCVNCEHVVVADQHGRCPLCQSVALAPPEDRQPWWIRKLQREAADPPEYTAEHEIAELERMWHAVRSNTTPQSY